MYYYLGKQGCLGCSTTKALQSTDANDCSTDVLLNDLPLPLNRSLLPRSACCRKKSFRATALAVHADYAEALSLLDRTELTDAAARLMRRNSAGNTSLAVLNHAADPEKQRQRVWDGRQSPLDHHSGNKPGRNLIEFSLTTPDRLRADPLRSCKAYLPKPGCDQVIRQKRIRCLFPNASGPFTLPIGALGV